MYLFKNLNDNLSAEKQTTSIRGEKSGLTTEVKLVEKQAEVELTASKGDQKGNHKELEKHEPTGDSFQEDTKPQKFSSDKTKVSKNEKTFKDLIFSPSPRRSR